MAAVKEHVLLSHPDKQVLLAEIPAASSWGSPQPVVTLRLLVELCSDYGDGPVDVDTMEDVACRVSLADLVGCRGAADRAFKDLVARIGDRTLRPEVAAQVTAAASRVRERCGEEEHDELCGVEFRLRVTFIDDTFEEEVSDSEDESGSDMEFDLTGARSLRDRQSFARYEDADDDEDGCGVQFFVRPCHGAEGETTLLHSGFPFQEEVDSDSEDDESGSDVELGEFNLSGARSLRDQQSIAGYKDDDEDDPYHGVLVREGETTPLLSGFEARSHWPELTESGRADVVMARAHRSLFCSRFCSSH